MVLAKSARLSMTAITDTMILVIFALFFCDTMEIAPLITGIPIFQGIGADFSELRLF